MNEPYDPFKDPLLMDHEVDGIRELDNNLPRWWVWLFNFSIIFAIGYICYYHVFHVGKLQAAQYAEESRIGDAIKQKALNEFENSLPNLTPSKDTAIIDHGHSIFLKNCAPCHRPDGGGLVGPNLCDDYWIHGSNFVDNLHTIVNGVPAKGMLTWRGVLKPNEIYSVASYIYTLRGTHPVNPKPPENQSKPAEPNAFE
jgi:cytochrome c oxidase cbb3-type subunit III